MGYGYSFFKWISGYKEMILKDYISPNSDHCKRPHENFFFKQKKKKKKKKKKRSKPQFNLVKAFCLVDMWIAKILLFGANGVRFRPMMAILMFSDHCKRPHRNPIFFKKMTQNLNLTLPNEVMLFSRHVNNQGIFYLVPIKWDLDKQKPFMCSASILKGHVKIPCFSIKWIKTLI